MGSAFGYFPGLDSARVDYRIAHARYCRDSGWENKNVSSTANRLLGLLTHILYRDTGHQLQHSCVAIWGVKL